MSNCDCNDWSDCKDDYGSYDESTYSGTVTSDPYHCYYDYESDYEYVVTINPQSDDVEYNEIDDWKNFYINGYFKKTPDPLIDMEMCDYEGLPSAEPRPGAVEFRVEHYGTWNDHDYKLDHPVPKDDGDSSAVMDFALSIVSYAASHPITKAGVAAAGAWIDTGLGSGVSFDEEYKTSDQQQFEWQIDVSGSTEDDYPQGPCDTNTAKFTVDLKADEAWVGASSRYLMGIPEYYDDGCPCNENYGIFYHWTDRNYNSFEVENAD